VNEAAVAATFNVTVRYRDGEERAFPVPPGRTVLTAAEIAGVPLLSECGHGICGACAGYCASGDYQLANGEGLSDDERAGRGILACQTRVGSDCVIEVAYSASDCPARMVSGTARVTSVHLLSENTALLSLDASALPDRLDFRPGQFAQLQVPGSDQWRSYSYCHLPDESGRLTFLIRLLPQGLMSDYLRFRAMAGDTLALRGSKGSFYLRPVLRPVVLMAGGTGLSAILSMLAQLAAEQVTYPVRMYYGVTERRDLCQLAEINELGARLADFRLQLTVASPDPEWHGPTGVITELLDEAALFGGDADVYLCGPPAMVDATRSWLAEHRLRRAQVFHEKFVASGSGAEPAPQPSPQSDPDWRVTRDQGRDVAVVIGGSITGICAAQMLSKYFARVVVVEQDAAHLREEGRPGAAQGWHLHHLLLAAQHSLEKIFPGIGEEMVREGAFRVDMAEQYRILMAGAWKKVFRSGIEIVCAGRPLLEWCLRRRLDAATNIEYRYQGRVTQLLYEAQGNQVLGVVAASGDQLETIPAGFVVDAAGKNTPVPGLLADLGIGAVEVEHDRIDAMYSTVLHKVPPARRWRDKVMVICYAYRPFQKHYCAQYYINSSRTILSTSLVAYDCRTPPRTMEDFLALARKMPSDVVARELEGLEPCSEIHNFRYPSMLRRRYESMAGLPRGLVAMGDAYCSADPVSGAGISKALMELEQLDSLLAIYAPDSERLIDAYYRQVSRIADRIWFVIREQNLRYPWIKDVAGKRPFYFGLLNWYMDRVVELSHSDPAVYARFLSVTHFVATPASLVSPALALRVVASWLFTRLTFRKTLIERNFGRGGQTNQEPIPVEP